MNFRKFFVAGALSCSLAFSSLAVTNQPAFAVEFSDTSGYSAEASINKLVSLGVMKHPGANFNPDAALTRAEFAYMVNQVMTLSAGKKVALKDLSSKNAAYTNTLKMINNGYLTVGKGYVKPSKGVTYAELSKALSQGLGLKKTWTNRPVDFLFYLVRKEVLDLDTDLDAVVTREAAAAAFDKFITQKGTFKTDTGIVVAVSAKGFTLNNGSENKNYVYASNVSPFVSGQAVTTEEVQVGSPATVVLNKKGTVAYYGGELLDAEEGPIKYIQTYTQEGLLTVPSEKDPIKFVSSTGSAKWKIGATGLLKDVNPDTFVAPLPNRPDGEFALKDFTNYSALAAGVPLVQFAGQAYFTNNDEVTAIYAYISKIENKTLTVSGNKVTVTFGAFTETFNVLEEAAITLNGTAKVKLADVLAKQTAGEVITATIEADKFGNVTTITATSAVPKK